MSIQELIVPRMENTMVNPANFSSICMSMMKNVKMIIIVADVEEQIKVYATNSCLRNVSFNTRKFNCGSEPPCAAYAIFAFQNYIITALILTMELLIKGVKTATITEANLFYVEKTI